MKQPS